jgi:hypothetical protein
MGPGRSDCTYPDLYVNEGQGTRVKQKGTVLERSNEERNKRKKRDTTEELEYETLGEEGKE